MNRGDLGLVLGLAGFLLGGTALFFAVDAKRETTGRWTDLQGMIRTDDEHIAGMGEKVRGLEKKADESTSRANRAISDARAALDYAKSLEERLVRAPVGGPRMVDESGKEASAKASERPLDAGEFDDLKKKLFADEATAEEQARFWELAREKPALLGDYIKELEKAAADAPRDKEAHRRLAEAYVAKLMVVPDGMEKGLWSNKSIAEQKKILELDPDDWGAHVSIATNYSFWPEQFNKRPDAIKEFEAARRIQEGRTPEPRFAHTYLQLRQLYLKEGKTDDAKAVLDEGLRRFPDDEELKKARDGVK
jgi:tetratricopeptide (TPR) repeat protein